MDNLNTHTTGSLYEAFPPAEAHRLAQRLEIHYTPKHGSWLNIAENELSTLTRQCLSRRIGTLQEMQRQTRGSRTAIRPPAVSAGVSPSTALASGYAESTHGYEVDEPLADERLSFLYDPC